MVVAFLGAEDEDGEDELESCMSSFSICLAWLALLLELKLKRLLASLVLAKRLM
jgi:hypothetical protein